MSIMEAFGYPNTRDAKAKLLDQIREAGAVRLAAGYSGGNDEGGVNDVELFDADGNKMESPEGWIERDPRPDDPEYRVRNGKVSEYHPLWEAADQMLSTEFGSWAGEFSAYGTLFADTRDGKVWREGSVQSGYDSDSAEY